MIICLLFSIIFLVTFINKAFEKQFQQGFKKDVPHFICYNLFVACFASVYFFVGSGFSLEMNRITLLFSFALATNVILALVLGVFVLSHTSIALSSVIATAGATIVPSLFGILFFNEPLSLFLILSIVFMLSAVIIPFQKNCSSEEKSSITVCFALFLSSGLSSIIQKIYTLTPGVCSSQSFFLMTNLIIASICIFAILIYSVFYKEKPSILFHVLTPAQLGNIGIRTLLSNIGSVVSITLLSLMHISVYSIISSSMGIISGALLSKFFFKEYMPRKNYISVLLAICAIILNSI